MKPGKRTAAHVVKLTIQSSPKTLRKMKAVNDTSSANVVAYTPEQALALIVGLELTKEDYIHMRIGAKERRADLYPSYHIIAATKRMCYPANILKLHKVFPTYCYNWTV